MHRGLIAGGLALLVFAMTASPSPVRPFGFVAFAESPSTYPLPVRVTTSRIDEAAERAVLNLINQERVAAGLVPLMPHAAIQSVARAHGREMFAAGYLTHLSSDGRSPRDRVLELGVRVRVIGENVAYASDARAAQDALIASEPHRRNILLPEYRLVGVAVLNAGSEGVIVVEDFADEGLLLHLPRWWERPAVPLATTVRRH